ncbi:acyl-CoA dehydrogenase family protein [Fictibacillus barbaricus]|uniref:Alkylation response protein AidB-like acyl-CoA dehydrogenase n=1 Tax=Fictibacillus barbaricus TaxID=182136 RepID=A0ABU1TWZ6_9BACL|nr:acyl-CoA dehydrogenase family protein [Fictibacillus barbaricus]MDR7071749.1 alkylation response protein AidB-like acyl-CoA dehydrogenase [Fictibacillus barbaricus]
MTYLYEPYIKTKIQRRWFEKMDYLAEKFSERADHFDREGRFPFENVNDLKKAGYLSLTIPKEFGGEGLSLYEFVLLQERIAAGDAATALCIGWHLGSFLELSEERTWDDTALRHLCEKVVQNQALVNRAATEPATGSPTRGGMPQTKATVDGTDWIINGTKTFTSMAPALDYAIVSAQIDDTGKKGNFLINMSQDGVKIEETWDTVAMRGTRSDDLIMENVRVGSEALVEEERGKSGLPKAWLLHIPACYLGVAIAARNEAVQFAKTYKPNSLPGPIGDVPEVQRKIGEMELELFKARELIYSVAAKWVNEPESRMEMGPSLLAVKHVATNSAAKVVDLAMRIVGARSLAMSSPLQRHYRDVRAGLHNPPMDDMVISSLAQRALNTKGD